MLQSENERFDTDYVSVVRLASVAKTATDVDEIL
jgi:hypothetical protein